MVLMAPVMQGIFWAGIIDKVMPLNLEEYFKGYLTMIFGVQPQSETTGIQGTNDEAQDSHPSCLTDLIIRSTRTLKIGRASCRERVSSPV